MEEDNGLTNFSDMKKKNVMKKRVKKQAESKNDIKEASNSEDNSIDLDRIEDVNANQINLGKDSSGGSKIKKQTTGDSLTKENIKNQ